MSFLSARSVVVAIGIAACAIVATVLPVQSWTLHQQRGAAHSGVRPPECTKGQYPDVDIVLINDYRSTTRSQPTPIVRIEMDIPACGSGDLSGIAGLLHNTATAKDIYDSIKTATNVADTASRGRRVLKAAIGFKDDNTKDKW